MKLDVDVAMRQLQTNGDRFLISYPLSLKCYIFKKRVSNCPKFTEALLVRSFTFFSVIGCYNSTKIFLKFLNSTHKIHE